jgi:bifunctional non-homologous end joining protein LigD
MLRHPSFQGLRADKPARKVERERPISRPEERAATMESRAKPEEPVVAGVRLTNPDRILYPEQGITKIALARFYEGIAGWILPHVTRRPLSVIRCPEGLRKECFYQRHADGAFHEAIRRLEIPENGSKGVYLAIDSLAGLIGLVQAGALELHTWGCRSDRIERPDRLIFDLDPDPAVPWPKVIEGARALRELLSGLGLAAFVKTTGGKGLHVVVPLARRHSWEEARDFSRAVAERMVRGAPDRYVATMSKAKRKGKIFIDFFRNARSATAIAAYSTRARAGAPVSTPLAWEELSPEVKSDHFNVSNLGSRLAELRKDPWDGYEKARRPITASMRKSLDLPGG